VHEDATRRQETENVDRAMRRKAEGGDGCWVWSTGREES
jgi:hypothetical protein